MTRFIAILFVVSMVNSMAMAQARTDTSQVRFHTGDIDLFWKAFDEFKKDTASNPFKQYLQDGSQAVRDFAGYMDEPQKFVKKRVKENLKMYEKIRPSVYTMWKYEQQVKEYFIAFRSIYPRAQFADVYFEIGFFNRGGTITAQGIVIGMEKFCNLPVDDMPVLSEEDLPRVIANGLVFFNQKPAHTGYTVLRESIVSGSSEFLTSLILSDADKRRLLSQPNYLYAEQYEETLVKEFLRERNGNDFRRWLYYPASPEGRPANLGSWIGYKITEAYYNSLPDKVKAISDILMINDFEKFLVLSGYAEPFRN